MGIIIYLFVLLEDLWTDPIGPYLNFPWLTAGPEVPPQAEQIIQIIRKCFICIDLNISISLAQSSCYPALLRPQCLHFSGG